MDPYFFLADMSPGVAWTQLRVVAAKCRREAQSRRDLGAISGRSGSDSLRGKHEASGQGHGIVHHAVRARARARACACMCTCASRVLLVHTQNSRDWTYQRAAEMLAQLEAGSEAQKVV